MREGIAWHVELAVKPGQLEPFRALTGEMVAATRREAGVLAYRRFVSEDGATVYIYERYADEAAALAHLRNFMAAFGPRFAAMVERRRFIVFGRPAGELREVLAGFGAHFAASLGDFEYWG
jgi:quinol monooxygenase YgiN